jgi:hypothetical protein
MPRALLFGIAIVWLWAFPYFRGIRHANELPRIYLVQAMVDEGSFAIDRGVARDGVTADLSRRAGHYYSNKAPGMSFLGVPPYLVAKGLWRLGGHHEIPLRTLTWILRVFASTLPCLLLLPLGFRLLRRLGVGPPAAWATIALLALGSGGAPYALQFMAHHVAGMFLLGALALGELGTRRRELVLAGALVGAAVLVEYQAAILGFPLGVYLLWRRRAHLPGARGADHPLAWMAAGALPPMALLLAYHAACFGSPFATGYNFAASAEFAAGHARGFLGLQRPNWDQLVGVLVAPRMGLLTVTPALLLVPLGIAALLRDPARRALGAMLAATTGVALAFAAGYHFWDVGWQIGQRYVAAAQPLLIVPVGVALGRLEGAGGRVGFAAAVGLCLASVAIVTPSMLVFPHWPDSIENPLRDLVVPLYRAGLAPYAAGRMLHLPGAWALAPAIALALALVLWPLRGRDRALPLRLAAALLVAALPIWFALQRPRGDVARADRAREFLTRIWEPDPR